MSDAGDEVPHERGRGGGPTPGLPGERGAADERPHEPGPGPLWSESWYVDFADDEGLGGFLRLDLHPAWGRAWVWAYLVAPGRLVAVRDHDVPLPRSGSLEVRGSGLWAALTCEQAMSHWTLGLEAFGVSLDDPAEAYRGERGERVPLGFDLEWEAVMPPFHHPQAGGRRHHGHYQHAGRVEGVVLVGSEQMSFEGFGERDHFWGERDWWGHGWHWMALRAGGGRLTMSVARPDRPGSEHATGYRALEGEDAHPIVRAEVTVATGPSGMPERASYLVEDDMEVDMDVLALAPVPVPAPDGSRVSRLHRALGRFRTPEGEGTGWAELLR